MTARAGARLLLQPPAVELQMKRYFAPALAAVFLPLSAMAAVDVAPITAANADILAVGVAVFAVAVAIKLYKWIRRAL
jgi:hypothetical protein